MDERPIPSEDRARVRLVQQLVAERELRATDSEMLEAYARMAWVTRVAPAGAADMEMLLDAIEAILGAGAVEEILGHDPLVTDAVIVAHTLTKRLSSPMKLFSERTMQMLEPAAGEC